MKASKKMGSLLRTNEAFASGDLWRRRKPRLAPNHPTLQIFQEYIIAKNQACKGKKLSGITLAITGT